MKTNKIALNTLKIGIISLCLLFGPKGIRGLVHNSNKTNKEYELENKDNILSSFADNLKEIDIPNSIMASKFITNMALDGYFTVDGCGSKNYNLLDENDYNIILNGVCTEKAISELVCKMLNLIYGDNVSAYSVSVKTSSKEQKDIDGVYNYDDGKCMCLISDYTLGITYLYLPLENRYIRTDNLNFSTDGILNYKVEWIDDLITGKYDIFNFIKIENNDKNNGIYNKDSFNKLIDKANILYNEAKIKNKLYDANRLVSSNKYCIYVKEMENRIPE